LCSLMKQSAAAGMPLESLGTVLLWWSTEVLGGRYLLV
jgi:hypothetical protein